MSCSVADIKDVTSVSTDIASGDDVYAPKTTLPSSRSVNDSVDRQNTTVFIDGGTKVVSLPTTQLSAGHRMQNMVVPKQTILDFLAKPHIVAQFDFQKTDLQLAVINSMELPNQLFASNEVLKSKVRYFKSFRGDVMIRVQANPSMAHSGKLLFVFFPFDNDAIDYTNRLEHLTSITQLPKVEFDLGTDRTAEFRVPYRMPTAYYQNISSPTHDYGDLKCVVYSTLRGGTTDTVPVTVWAWFDPDTVVLANPVADNDIPIGAAIRSNRLKKVCQQAGGLEVEKDSSKKSTSNILGSVAAIATTAASVPVLSEVAAPVAWAAAIASKAAAAFGFSNPRQELAPSLVLDRGARDLCTVDQAVPGYVFGYSGASRLGKTPTLGLVDEDELSFAHLLPISVYREILAWDDTDSVGMALISAEAVNLENLGRSTGALYYHYAPYLAIAGMFSLWRGYIRFTFKIAKTRFHSGRLLVCFDCDVAGSVPTLAETDPLLRMVIDLESGNEWTFECPFPMETDYVGYTNNIGRLSLFVLTPLSYAAGSSDTVDIIVETSMRADASFCYPRGDSTRWLEDAALARKRVVAQAGGYSLPSGSKTSIDLTNNVETLFMDPLPFEVQDVGDACRSLRTYIKRGTLQNYTATQLQFAANTIDSLTQVNDVMKSVIQWYALMRGSMRYSIRPKSPRFLELCMAVDSSAEIATTTTSGYVQFLQQDKFSDIEVPQMFCLPWRYAVPLGQQSGLIGDYPVIRADASADYQITAAAADDFDLCMFIGILPVEIPPLLKRGGGVRGCIPPKLPRRESQQFASVAPGEDVVVVVKKSTRPQSNSDA